MAPAPRDASGRPARGSARSIATSLHAMVQAQAARTPRAIAAVCDGRSISYSELNARANRLAHHLRRQGVGPDVLVGLLVTRSLEMLVGLLGILKAGGAYVPLDPEYPPDRISFILSDASAPLVVTDRASVGRLAPGMPALLVDPADTAFADEPAGNPLRVSGGDDLAYVIYTSGSTGRPKGVQVTHRGVVNFLRSMRRQPGLDATDVVAAVTTICFDIAGLELFLPLTVGARTIIVSHEDANDGRRLARAIAESGVTLVQATPATWRLLLDAGWNGSPHLRLLCGGEAMPRELANRLLERCGALWNMYGPTETTVWSTLARVGPGDGPVPLGAPIDNTTIHILDDDLKPVGDGVEGELCIGGAGVARGYVNRPDLTAERFVADPFSEVPGARLYRTGDLARRLADGTLLFGGRRDQQVKIRGFRIELGEIENSLLRNPVVGQAAVVATEDGRGGKRLVACVVGRPGAGIAARDVRERLRATLPAYMVPSRVVALDELPLTPNGKIDRRALVARLPDAAADGTAPRDQVEARLAHLWEDVLELRPVSVDADFFELGGDSLHAAALFARIAREFGKDLPVAELVRAPTVAELARLLRDDGTARRWTPVVPFRASGSKRPLFFVHGGAGTVLFLHDLVAGLDRDRPVYGLQSEGQDGRRVVHDTVEGMARLYLEALRKVQPAGPYHLAGYCFGGTVAFEMAQQLRRDGQEVSFLGLVNAPCPLAGPAIAAAHPDAARLTLLPAPAGWAARLPRFRELSWSSAAQAVARQVTDALRWRRDVLRARRPGRRLGRALHRLAFALGVTLPKARRPGYILAMTEQAEGRYRPRPYDGPLVVIRGDGLYHDPALGWNGLAASIETRTVGGPQRLRRELIAPPLVGLLAAELSERLDQADRLVDHADAVSSPRPLPDPAREKPAA